MKIVLIIVGILALGLGITWIDQGNDFFLQKVFMPRLEQVRYDTFKHSTGFTEGAIKDLEDLQVQYINAPADAKPAVRTIILNRASMADWSTLPPDIRIFITNLRSE